MLERQTCRVSCHGRNATMQRARIVQRRSWNIETTGTDPYRRNWAMWASGEGAVPVWHSMERRVLVWCCPQ
jgi:hypothetical protein